MQITIDKFNISNDKLTLNEMVDWIKILNKIGFDTSIEGKGDGTIRVVLDYNKIKREV